MEITVAIIITALTLVAGQITKLTSIDNKWIPLQNIIIAVIASIVCIVFKVENMGILETIVTCVFGTMSAGGIADLINIVEKENVDRDSLIQELQSYEEDYKIFVDSMCKEVLENFNIGNSYFQP